MRTLAASATLPAGSATRTGTSRVKPRASPTVTTVLPSLRPKTVSTRVSWSICTSATLGSAEIALTVPATCETRSWALPPSTTLAAGGSTRIGGIVGVGSGSPPGAPGVVSVPGITLWAGKGTAGPGETCAGLGGAEGCGWAG